MEQPPLHLHHLPSRGQNFFYSLLLVLSPLANLVVNICTYQDFRQAIKTSDSSLVVLNWSVGLSGFLLGASLLLLWLNLLQALARRHRAIRHSLLLFGVFSTLYLIDNLITLTVGIFAVKIQSYALLLISVGIYLSLNTVFLFWYWYVDYPSHIHHLHHPQVELEIAFPDDASSTPEAKWLPSFFDYLYFTVITSNTLGPPESHVILGTRAKMVQMLHSLLMLVLLVIFVSRAINTLS